MTNYIFDLDGTIVENGQPISSSIVSRLKEIQDDHRIIFASARPIRDMLPLIPEDFHPNLMIGCNGGMAWENKEFVFCSYFEEKIATDIISFLQQEKIPYILDSDWKYAVSSVPHSFHDYLRNLSTEEVCERELNRKYMTKILILDGNSRKIVDLFLSSNGYSFNINHHKSDNCFDITPQVENKYSALTKLGIDFKNSIAFGNDVNDFRMLDQAQVSVFVGSITDYSTATIYCSIEDIPDILDTIKRLGIVDSLERQC